MKSIKIRSDFTVKLPEELRVKEKEPRLSLTEMIDRISRNTPVKPLSDSDIEEIVHQVRQRR